jgi:hypothetical protein
VDVVAQIARVAHERAGVARAADPLHLVGQPQQVLAFQDRGFQVVAAAAFGRRGGGEHHLLGHPVERGFKVCRLHTLLLPLLFNPAHGTAADPALAVGSE